jgi:hypothetical protein
MDAQGVDKIQELRARLERGEYHVDPGAIADAVIRRAAGLDLAGDYARQFEITPAPPARSRRRARPRTGESRFTARAVVAS